MEILVIHELFGLTWDELASIVGIFVAVCTAIRWLTHCINNALNENVHKPIDSLNSSVDGLRGELKRHAEKSSETLIKMQDKDNDFESRISWLENAFFRLFHIKK